MKPGRVIVALLAAGGLSWAAWRGLSTWQTGGGPSEGQTKTAAARETRDTAPAPAVVNDSTARAPTGVRVRVQVVNATRTRGLARRATRWLRARGFDVVEVGTAGEQRDSTLVLDRSGHPDWAARAARALGGARVEARPDSSRYLDLTVLVGRSWRPSAEPLDP